MIQRARVPADHATTFGSDRNDPVIMLEADGGWCPMAHGSRHVSSFQACSPLRRVRTSQKITSPFVSSHAAYSLGAFTGEARAICTYVSPRHPALVAFDYRDGSVQWTSSLEDLPGGARRGVAAILMAKMRVDNGPVQRRVFAANPVEFVAYAADGTPIWKRYVSEIAPASTLGIGGPVSLTYNDAGELVTATDAGWIIKLDPVNGRIIDAYRMDTSIVIRGRTYEGTFVSPKSVVACGNVLYLVAEFRPDPLTPLPPTLCPVYVVRIELRQPGSRGNESRIKPLTQPENTRDLATDRIAIGVHRAGGSPSAWVTPEGRVWIFANAEAFSHDGLKPVVTAVEDGGGGLRVRWRCILAVAPGMGIHAAPALHEDTRTLLVGTARALFVIRDADVLSGNVASPRPIPGQDLIGSPVGPGIFRVGLGSPFALTFDPDRGELVVYANVRVSPFRGHIEYGFLAAFALPLARHSLPRPLWTHPLAITPAGLSAPGPGSFGQPALFRYPHGNGQASGLIINTVRTGTYILK